MLTILGGLAEFERELIRAGRAKAASGIASFCCLAASSSPNHAFAR